MGRCEVRNKKRFLFLPLELVLELANLELGSLVLELLVLLMLVLLVLELALLELAVADDDSLMMSGRRSAIARLSDHNVLLRRGSTSDDDLLRRSAVTRGHTVTRRHSVSRRRSSHDHAVGSDSRRGSAVTRGHTVTRRHSMSRGHTLRRGAKVERRQDNLNLAARSLGRTKSQPRLIIRTRTTKVAQSSSSFGNKRLGSMIVQSELEHVLGGIGNRDVERLVPDRRRTLVTVMKT